MEERLSTSKVEVFRIGKVEDHPDADRLELVEAWGYVCVVKKGQFKEGDLAAYIPPETVLPNEEKWSFIWKGNAFPKDRQRRIKASRLRGILSAGLIIEAPEGKVEGDDLWDEIGCTHYEPPISNKGMGGGEQKPITGPPVPNSTKTYDVENGFRYHEAIEDGTQVLITEKIHGANARFLYYDGVMYAGSRKLWSSEGDNLWWRIVDKYPMIRTMCEHHEGWILYGEIYGCVQSLKYGHTQDNPIDFAAFDVFNGNKYLDVEQKLQFFDEWDIPAVPIIDSIHYSFNDIGKYVSGPSMVNGATHIREGIVVTPFIETYHRKVGRLQLKFVSNEYLEGKDQ
jgi:RNA ligase (TIGR02306 family)